MSIKSQAIEITAQEFQCPICYNIKIPLMCKTPCMHSVCHDCYTTNPNKSHCPICNTNTGSRTDWVRNEFEERLLQRFSFHCDDCNTKLSLAQVARHPDICTRRPVVCSHAHQGCEWQGRWDQLHDHICPYEKVECQFCMNSFYKGALTQHQESCNYKPHKCTKCGKIIHQWQQPIHIC